MDVASNTSTDPRRQRPGRMPRIGEEAGEHPASHGQRALWFLHRLDPESGAYNIAVAVRLLGDADREPLRRAFQALVDRHPALRTTLTAPGGEPRQRIRERMDLDWQAEDASGWDEERLAARLSEEAFRPFDLEAGPLLRVRLYAGAHHGDPGNPRDTVLLVLHHAISDLWSITVLVRELGMFHAGEGERLPPPAVRYSDFVRWQEEQLRGPEGERLWSYWRERLAGSLPVLELSTDQPRPPVQTWRGVARSLRLGPDEAAALKEYARERGATLFVLLLAAFDALLHRLTGQDDLLVGAPAANRRARELAGVVGYFVNPVALRADLSGDPSWRELMERMTGTVPDDLAHQAYPFPLLAERLVPERDPSRPPIFQAMLVHERAPARAADIARFALGEGGARLRLGDLEVESIALRERRVLVDVTLAVSEGGDDKTDGLTVSLQVNSDLFDAATAGRMLGQWRTLLAAAVAEPGRRLSDLPLLSLDERSELLVERNLTGRPWPDDLLLHEPFEGQAARNPEAVALIWDEERISYGDLNRRANRIAHRLRGLGVGPEVRVGVHLRRSPGLVAALLGVLKAGGAYVPLDPSYPAERLEYVRRDAGVAVVISDPDFGDGGRDDDPERLAGPGNLAYVLYTSGSTGLPKGCAVEHRSPVAFVSWAREVFPPEELAGVLAATSIGFDLSVFELFVPLSAGGCVILADDVLALPRLAAREEVRLVNTVPSAMAELERVWGLPAGVRTVNLAGEPLRRDLADRLYGRGVERVFNLYGPTEDTTYSTFTLVPRESTRAPAIGRPLANRRVYLLDRRGRPGNPVPDGVPGEIFLGGAGLARGYLGRPDLTAGRFVPDAWSGLPGGRLYATGDLARWRRGCPDDELELLGRIDHQVKIRGFRIEMGEIEAVLASHPDVLEAAVVVREGPGGDRRLAAYVAARPGVAPGSADLQQHLRRRLPDYMVPAIFVLLPALPKTASGKVDRRALPIVSEETERIDVPPRNPTETALAALWSELLGRAPSGIHDSFFDLGGHSLLAARLVARVREEMGVDLPLAAVLASPTVAGLAERIAGGSRSETPPIRPVPRDAPLPLSYGQRQIWLDDRMRPWTALYNMPAAVELAGALDPAALEAALAGIVRRHEALRAVFAPGEDEPVCVPMPGSLSLPLVDLSALPSTVRKEEAGRLAIEEARRPFDLASGLFLRALLLRLDEADHRLVLTLHHIAADGWSFGVLAHELPMLYAGGTLPEPSVQYGDYAAWQRRWLTPERLAPRLAAARERLADVPRLDFPGRRSLRGGSVSALLPKTETAAARDLARRENATLPMLLLAAFSAVLARTTGAPRFAVGVPLANRGRAEVAGMIGYLVNPVAVRVDVPDSGGFRGLLAAVRSAALAAWAEEELPFELVVRELGAARTASDPVFQVMHVHQEPPPVPDLPGLAARRLPLHTATAKLSLTLATSEMAAGLEMELEHALDAVSPAEASRLLFEIRTLLAEALADPGRPLLDLPVAAESERRQLASVSPVEDATPPRTHIEEVLAGIWAGLLGLPRVGVHADLFALGAHSLLATRVVSRLREALGVELPLGQVIERRTVAELAETVEQARRESPAERSEIPILPRGGDLPLSFAQERLWFLDRLEPGSPAYNMPGAMLLRGRLDVGALRSAVAGLIARHEVLRTGFEAGGGRPAARVRDCAVPPVPSIDLSALPGPVRSTEERRLTRDEARAPFRLDEPPLLRVRLLRLNRDEHLLLLTLHHIVCDGWSLSVLTREIAALYTAASLPPLPIQFADYAAWQRASLTGEVLEDLLAGWREHLAGAPPTIELPTDRPRPEEQGARKGAIRSFSLPADLTDRLAAAGRERGATPFMVHFAGFQALLHRLSGQGDLVVGTPIAGRTRVETEDLIGLFVNVLPIRARLDPKLPFAAALDGVRDSLLEAYARQELPFERLVEALTPERALGRSPLFQILFVLQNAPAPPIGLPGLELAPREAERAAAKFDLTLELRPDGKGLAEYDPALWDEPTVIRLLDTYERLLATVDDPDHPLADLRLLAEPERHQLLLEWNDLRRDWGREGNLCLHELIEEQAARTPDEVAVEMDAGQSWTYAELVRRAGALAGHLRALGAGPETVVAISAERSPELLAGLLAILQSGAAYLPLDPAYPQERLERMMEEAGAPLLLLGEGMAELRTAARVVRLRPLTPQEPGEQKASLPLSRGGWTRADRERGPGGEGLAYVIYTSGSTGRPKGAMNVHRAVVNRLLWARSAHSIEPADRVLQKTPIGFDVSVWELFLPLLSGARLVLARPGGHQDPDYLADLILRRRVTVVHFVPSLLQLFLESPEVGRCAAVLRRVVASGEALPPRLAGRFGERLPGVALDNLYGPTEAAVDVTAWTWTGEDGRPVPIGRPVANVQIHVFDAGMRPAPIGVAGELMIGGVQLARGYLGRPDLTAERFVPDPLGEPGGRLYRTGDLARHRADGAVEFLGRIDQQVKIRGVRIELAEVEAALGGLPGVTEAAAVVREDRPGDRRLVAYLVPAGASMPPAELRDGLARTLPPAMIPSFFVELPALPHLASGKLDRRALSRLQAPGQEETGDDSAPRTDLEERLAGIWKDVLGLERIGIDDSFFDLGGHSLLAVQLVAEVRSRLGIEVSLRRLFEAPTVASFARMAARMAPDPERIGETIPRRSTDAPAQLSFGQRRLWFLDRWQPGSPAYNLHAALDLDGALDVRALAASLAEVARRHEVLRTRYPSEGDEPSPTVEAGAPELPVIDLSGLSEAGVLVERLAAEEELRPFDLASGPVLRARLLRLPERHVLLLTVHHIAADGWSLGVLVREMAALYAARPLSEPRLQYADFAAWQAGRLQGEMLARLLGFWQAQLADAPTALELPTDRPRPAVRRERGGRVPFDLDPEAAGRLADFARERGATSFMALLAGFGALLQRYTGESRIVVGAPVAGRVHPDTADLVGFFVNSLALPLDLAGDPTFEDLLARTRETALAAFSHQELPFERLVEELRLERDPSRTPVFQVMLALQNAPMSALTLPGLTVTPRPAVGGASKLDLLLSLSETGSGLAGDLTYDSDLFDRTTAERLAGHLRRLLSAALEEGGRRLSELAPLDETERHQLLDRRPVLAGKPPAREAPSSPVEEVLAAVWSEVLGCGPVSRHESFFGLGGHSLLAIQAVSRLRRSLGVELTLRDLFEAPTVARLALRVEAALRDGSIPAAPPLRPGRGGAPSPLSFAQERLWFLDRLEPGSAAYHIPAAVRLTGRLDPVRLSAALGGVVERHEALRTRFAEIDGRPVQIVEPAGAVPLPVADLSALPPAVRAAEAERRIAAEARRPFDLERGPLLRALLLRLGEADHAAVLTLHHIASDGWSRTVLLRDLASAYRGEPLPALPVQYGDFAVWQREWLTDEAREAPLGWWREALAGLPPWLDLPTDRPRPAVVDSRGAMVPVALSSGRPLTALVRREGASLFMAVLAAFEALLGRYTGRDDVAVGVPLAGRDREEIEDLIGFFVNPVVMRLDLSGGPTFRELLAWAREATLGAWAHQDLPFELLVEALAPRRELGSTPLFQVALAFQNTPRTAFDLPGLTLSPLPAGTGTSKFDLTLALEDDLALTLAGTLEYRTGLFDKPTVLRLLGHLDVLLAAAVADPDRRVDDLPLLSAPESAQVLREWNATAAAYPSEASVYALFLEQAGATPDAVAVVQGETVWSYAELRDRAEALARHLDGLRAETRVALLLERGPDVIAAILAILSVGAVYVPLDPAYPAERLAFLLADSGADVVLTETRHLPLLPGTSAAVVCTDGRGRPSPHAGEGSGVRALPGGDALACVLYTSGSTGVPKGVAVLHRGIVRLVRCTDYATYGPDDATYQMGPLAFDAATFEIWGALLNGGRVVLAPPGVPSPDDIIAAVEAHGITMLWLTAGLFHVLVEQPATRAALGRLRQLLTGGDVVSPPHAALALEGGARLGNFYGPTEGTTFSSFHPLRLPLADRPLPIGRPIANTRMYVLDRSLRPLPVGVPGELYVGGDGLARGYLDRPDLTAERFIPDPFADSFAGPPGGRLYRTGDLGRLLPDGNMDFLGRTDNQVKIRGFRIEPGEVEAALLRLPEVAGAAVLAITDPAGEKSLAAFYTAADPVSPPSGRRLRERLQESLPPHLVPTAFFLRTELPLSPNGKVDRAALAREAPLAPVETSMTAPRNPIEEMVAGIWAEALGIGEAGIHDDFFELGGHSLLAARAVSRLRESFGVEVPLRELFEAPTPAGLAAFVERALRGGEDMTSPPITPVRRDAQLLPSFAQERLWFLDRLAPGGDAYNVPWTLRLRGRLDPAELAAALGTVAARHEVLRTIFGEVEGRPRLEIAPVEASLPVIDLAGLPAPRRESERLRLAAEEARRPFDLARGPLLRAALVRLEMEETAEEHHLLLTLHHAVCDGGSMPILVREVLAVLQGRSAELPGLPIQYADYAAWQRRWLAGDVLDRELAWWRQRLAGAPPLLDLPLDRPRPRVRRPRGAVCGMELSADLTRALAGLGRRRGATLFMTLLTAFDLLLSRHSGQEDLCIGFPVAGRNRVELENLVGLFVNTLVARADLSGDPPFADLLTRVRERVLEAYAHQEVPFERLVEELAPRRDLSLTPLFQVLFVLQSQPGLADGSGAIELPGLAVEPIGHPEAGTAKLDLTLAVTPRGPGLAVALDYDATLFDRTTAQRLLGHWRTLLAGIVETPEANLSELPLLTRPERAQVLEEWSGAGVDIESRACLHHLVEAQADRTPDAVALVAGRRELTYAELDAAANRLAHALLLRGVGPDAGLEKRVAVCLGRSADLVIALLAVLKAGAAYVPLDPRYPPARLALLLEDSRAAVLVTERRWLSVLPDETPSVCLLGECEDPSESRPRIPIDPGNLAYVIYTSGSTGRPKGVGIEHRSAAALVAWAREAFPAPALESVLAVTSVCFDLSVFEIFVPLATGGRVILVEDALAVAPGATLINTVPSAMAELVRSGSVPSSAITLNLAGEPLPRPLVEALHELEPPREVLNLYGPTETTTYSTLARMVRGDGRPPAIGRPVAGDRVYLVDRHLRPVPAGVAGEVLIGGAGLARGYVGRPDWTALRFVPDPFTRTPGSRLYRTGDLARWRPDGELELVGRIDDQAKLRGFRVEPGEVEAVLLGHPAVVEAAVVVRDGRLVAYAAAPETTVADLRGFLAERLPAYLLPSALLLIPILPRTANGKVDRAALPPPEGRPEAQPSVPPSGPTEEALALIWGDLLGVEAVGVNESFFDLGGHSLLGAQLLARVRSELRVELPLQILFESPTVAALALEVDRARQETPIPVSEDAIPRVTDDRDATELLSRLDELSDDEVAALLREMAG